MSFWVYTVIALVAAYLIGAVPFALIVGKLFYSKDPREYGSGNLGATNVFRVLGWKAGLATALLDVAKGAAAVGVTVWIHPVARGQVAFDGVMIACMIAAMAGHSYSPYIRFTGGKGVAVAAGGLLLIAPLAWPILFLTFVAVVAAWKMVSLGSVIIAIEFPLLTLWLYPDRTAIVWLSFGAAALVVWRHRSNLARIFRGQEARIAFRRVTEDNEEGAQD